MSDTITVREACEHQLYEEHKTCGCVGVLHSHHNDEPAEWFLCPGGKEIILRRTTLKDHTVKPDDVMYVEADNG